MSEKVLSYILSIGLIFRLNTGVTQNCLHYISLYFQSFQSIIEEVIKKYNQWIKSNYFIIFSKLILKLI